MDIADGRYLEMPKPSEYFASYTDFTKGRRNKSLEKHQYKILKRYFEYEVKQYLSDVWFDESIENKLDELKFRVADSFFDSIYISNTSIRLFSMICRFSHSLPMALKCW